MFGRRWWRQWLAGSLSGSVLLLAGCGDFFSKNTGGGGGSVGSYLYVGTGGGGLASYSVSTTGALAALAGSPLSLATSSINSLAVTPKNGMLYAAIAGAGVYGLSIASGTGVPTLINTSALVQDVSPVTMTIDPAGNHVLVAGLYNGGPAVGEYLINSDGTLSEVQGSPVAIKLPSGADATNLTVQNIVVAPNSSYVFVSLGQLGVAPLAYTTGGALTTNAVVLNPKATSSGVSNQDIGLAVDSGSKFLFVGETNAGVRVITISASFPEVSGSPFKAGGQPRSIVLDGTGGFVYAANASDNTISGYSLQANGALTALAGSPFSSVGTGPYALTLDQSKKYLIETNQTGSPFVQLYSFDSTTAGKINPGATVTNNAASQAVATTH